MEKKTHWKQLVNPDYLGAYSLQPGEIKTLTIERVTREKVIGPGGKKQECTVIHFAEKEKPMILNRLNSKVISKLYGTPYIEDWPGKKVKIKAELVEAFGETVEALRICQDLPTLPELKKDSIPFKNAVMHISKGGSFEDVEKRFILTPEIKSLIEKEAKNDAQ